ncbi:sterol desaturase family protein [Haliea sp.]|uniref:sterol desaturase family protein n=1 Tax=Haliea sp. TaxID=1932666 RepID=UPI0035299030
MVAAERGWHLAWLLLGGLCLIPATLPLSSLPLLNDVLPALAHHVLPEKARYSPLGYWLLLTLVWQAQRRWPVVSGPFLSLALRQDMLWYVTTMGLRLLFLGAWAHAVVALYTHYLGFLTLPGVAHWHPAAQFVLGVLLADFTRWLSHLIRHKVPLFWAFHSVHHSQRDLNLFTDARVHPVDRMVSSLITSFALLITGNGVPAVILWMLIETLYPKFYHANVRLDLGPLRYLLVTPQSHRVHHGVEHRYHDCNFGFLFSVWDRLFGTQHPEHRIWPATGIPDADFPVEREDGVIGLLKTLGRQLVYPFLSLHRRA